MIKFFMKINIGVVAFDTSNGGSWDAVSAKSRKWA